jgi:hypothetical protein
MSRDADAVLFARWALASQFRQSNRVRASSGTSSRPTNGRPLPTILDLCGVGQRPALRPSSRSSTQVRGRIFGTSEPCSGLAATLAQQVQLDANGIDWGSRQAQRPDLESPRVSASASASARLAAVQALANWGAPRVRWRPSRDRKRNRVWSGFQPEHAKQRDLATRRAVLRSRASASAISARAPRLADAPILYRKSRPDGSDYGADAPRGSAFTRQFACWARPRT